MSTNNNNKCKLLAPVGSEEVLIAAVFAGCDCVYLSGNSYGARGFADNFSLDQLSDAIEFCHEYNVEVYVTVNTLILENELREVLDYIYWLYIHGVDAVIIQDLGLASIVHKLIPDLSLHASTQMTINDYSFVKWLDDFGFDNVNLSREVPLSRVSSIIGKLNKFNKNHAKIEVFCHGALCYCYSGQCLMSSFLGGRSGNRGLCAQPCRMQYSLQPMNSKESIAKGYLLSTNDLCTYENIPNFVKTGVDCIKIEGRMKSYDYVSCVTQCYRNMLDNAVEEDDELLLNLAFNRGFTEGYISEEVPDLVVGRKTSGSKGYNIGIIKSVNADKIKIGFNDTQYPITLVNGDGLMFESDKGTTGMYVTNIFHKNKSNITISNDKNLRLKVGSKVYLNYSKVLHDKTKQIVNRGRVVKTPIDLRINIDEERNLIITCSSTALKEDIIFNSQKPFLKAENKPLTKKVINKQLRKTGNTNYDVTSISYDNFYDDLFMPISVLNEIRRELISIINSNIAKSYIPTNKSQVKTEIDKYVKANLQKREEATVNNKSINLSCYISDSKQAESFKNYPLDTVYYDGSFNYSSIHDYLSNVYNDLVEIDSLLNDNTNLVWVLPRLLLDKDIPDVSENIIKLRLHNNIDIKVMTDSVGVADAIDADCYGNNLNIFNNKTVELLKEDPGFKRLTLSPELALDDIKLFEDNDIDLEFNVCGNVEVMISNDDFYSLINGNTSEGYYIINSRGDRFKLYFDCYNHSHIFDYRLLNLDEYVLYLSKKTNVSHISLDCKFMDNNDTNNIIKHYVDIMNEESTKKLELNGKKEFFKGNFRRGVYTKDR